MWAVMITTVEKAPPQHSILINCNSAQDDHRARSSVATFLALAPVLSACVC